jgi:hypothetical protein
MKMAATEERRSQAVRKMDHGPQLNRSVENLLNLQGAIRIQELGSQRRFPTRHQINGVALN